MPQRRNESAVLKDGFAQLVATLSHIFAAETTVDEPTGCKGERAVAVRLSVADTALPLSVRQMERADGGVALGRSIRGRSQFGLRNHFYGLRTDSFFLFLGL